MRGLFQTDGGRRGKASHPVSPLRRAARIEESVVTLSDGRRVGVARAGPPARQPIVYVHGFLGSRYEAFVVGEPSHDVVTIDRPGYGLSDPLPSPSLSAFAADLDAVLEALGIERCILVGGSAGAPYALATAVLHPTRVKGLVLVAGVAHARVVRRTRWPMRWLVDFAEIPLLNERMVPFLLRLLIAPGVTPGWLLAVLTPEQEAIASSEAMGILAKRLAASMRAGSKRGPLGVQTDFRLLTTPWEFDHTTLAVPCRLVHGGADGTVPLRHGQWYASNLPGARLRVLPRHHHVTTIMATAPRIFALGHRLEQRLARREG